MDIPFARNIKVLQRSDVTVRLGSVSDLPGIMDIVWRTVMLLQSEHNYQWSDAYPTKADFAEDLAAGALYVATADDEVVGFLTLDKNQPPEYGHIQWALEDCPVMVVHRFAVSPELHRMGIGTALLIYAQARARQQGAVALRTDTCTLNVRMRALFSSFGFVQRPGTIKFFDCPNRFRCFEKQL